MQYLSQFIFGAFIEEAGLNMKGNYCEYEKIQKKLGKYQQLHSVMHLFDEKL